VKSLKKRDVHRTKTIESHEGHESTRKWSELTETSEAEEKIDCRRSRALLFSALSIHHLLCCQRLVLTANLIHRCFSQPPRYVLTSPSGVQQFQRLSFPQLPALLTSMMAFPAHSSHRRFSDQLFFQIGPKLSCLHHCSHLTAV